MPAGIRIVAAPSAPDTVLPRMDIGVFAGFASAGPLHLPLAVESVAQFRAVFGDELTLAWDAIRGEPLTAHLAAAVAAFFANGGQRCWVIRLARTLAMEALWRGLPNAKVLPDDLVTTNRFPVPGVLAIFADAPGAVAATAVARSAGSWSDRVRIATGLTAAGFDIAQWQPLAPPRVRLNSGIALLPGDLVQFGDPDLSGPILYGRVDAASGLDAEILLLAGFSPWPPADSTAGSALIAGITAAPLPATLQAQSSGARIVFDVPVPEGTEPGQWVRWTGRSGDEVWLLADAVDMTRAPADPSRFTLTVTGTAWQDTGAAIPATAPTHGLRLVLDMQATNAAAADGSAQPLPATGLTPQHPAAWWLRLGDDDYYQTAAEPADRFPLAAAEAMADAPLAWLPLGVASLDRTACAAFPQAVTPLERDGLSRYDAELFLDPELADLDLETIAAQADDIRFLSEAPRRLFGIHAALGIGNTGHFDEATLLAIPDALHPGWTLAVDPVSSPSTPRTGPVRIDTGFIDCAHIDLIPPVLTGPDGPVAVGTFRLQWTEAAPGIAGVLVEATDAGFSFTRELSDGAARHADIEAEHAGSFYYRVEAFAGAAKIISNVLSVVVRQDAWVAIGGNDYAASGEAQLLRVQQAALRLAAANGELFTVLGLPRHVRGPDIKRLAVQLAAAVGIAEQRALSFGALYHPWLANGALRPTPPDGGVLGMIAGRARQRGAWIAPANESLRDVVALLPPADPASLPELAQAHINMLVDAPRGFLALSARTLSAEDGLGAINIRRLLILLRRLALRQGANWVFEPLGDTLRRSVQRGFTQVLADLFRRGAFAGRTEAEAFAVVVGDGVSTQADLDNGRLIVELRIAPSDALQFLTLRLVQTGERLSVSEQA
jgi:hypothetical protein